MGFFNKPKDPIQDYLKQSKKGSSGPKILDENHAKQRFGRTLSRPPTPSGVTQGQPQKVSKAPKAIRSPGVKKNATVQFYKSKRMARLEKLKWKPSWIAGLIVLMHPLGAFYTSWKFGLIGISFTLISLFSARVLGTNSMPFMFNMMLAFICAREVLANNKLIEKHRYGLPGTGFQNPKKAGLAQDSKNCDRSINLLRPPRLCDASQSAFLRFLSMKKNQAKILRF